jgi:hypothetical protein
MNGTKLSIISFATATRYGRIKMRNSYFDVELSYVRYIHTYAYKEMIQQKLK